ncbi:hypothetical protein ACHAXS_009959 [Conticribra weissflogii]
MQPSGRKRRAEVEEGTDGENNPRGDDNEAKRSEGGQGRRVVPTATAVLLVRRQNGLAES